MSQSRKTNSEVVAESQRLRAQVAQLEDRLDHMSEHGAAAKVLHESEEFHCEVMGVVSDAVLITDETGRLTYVSPNAHYIFGQPAADILKQGRIGVVLPGVSFDPDVLEQRGEIANIDCVIRDAVGRARNLLVAVRRVETQKGRTLYVCRDVTERIKIQLDYDLLSLTLERRVEERTSELRESRERYRRLVEGLRDEYLFYATNKEGIITYVSPSLHTILGYAPAQVMGRNWREFVDPQDTFNADLERLEQMRFSNVPTPVYFATIRHADGGTRILEFRDIPLQDADGRVIANEGIGKDVTKRHEQEEALRKAHEELEHRVRERTAELTAKNEQLRESQDRYRSVIQDHLEFIIRWRNDGVRTFVNDSYCRHCHAHPDALIGTSFMSSIVEEDRDVLRQKLACVSVDNPVVEHEHRIVSGDGRTIWEHWTHRALYSPQQELVEFQSIGCDVTERRKREEHDQERTQALSQLRALSDREYDVMRLVVAGDANKVMARKLGLSIKTIEKHRSSLMKKLRVRSVPELVGFALLIENTGAA